MRVHHKYPAQMDASGRFLVSYLDSLIALKVDTNIVPRNGKMVITHDRMAKIPRSLPTEESVLIWSPPDSGWMKMNSDGSFALDGVGSGMVLCDDQESIIFSAQRQLFSCRKALEVELCACMKVLSMALQINESRIVVEPGSIVDVKMIDQLEKQ